MAQHFLLSAAARTLSSKRIARMTEEEAYEMLKQIRWAETNGEPVCPRCGCAAVYHITTRRKFKCKACHHQFSVTSGTKFASRKLPIRDYLLAIVLFVNEVKGRSALNVTREADVSYKTAFTILHKLRESISEEQMDVGLLEGEVEIDGAYFGGYIRPANRAKDRIDRRKKQNQTGKRQVVVVMRERNGRTLPFVFAAEHHAVPEVLKRIAPEATLYTDEAHHWDRLHMHFKVKRIDHQTAYSAEGACTNQAESYHSRLRRSEIGVHHRIAGRYFHAYAQEMAWREDNKRRSNGEQFLFVANAAMQTGVSRQWKGYWQRHKKT